MVGRPHLPLSMATPTVPAPCINRYESTTPGTIFLKLLIKQDRTAIFPLNSGWIAPMIGPTTAGNRPDDLISLGIKPEQIIPTLCW